MPNWQAAQAIVVLDMVHCEKCNNIFDNVNTEATQPISDELQRWFDHGIDNEINAQGPVSI